MINKYEISKKTELIDAFRLGIDPIPDWFKEILNNGTNEHSSAIEIASYNDYFFKDNEGYVYLLQKDFFEANYEPYYEHKSMTKEEWERGWGIMPCLNPDWNLPNNNFNTLIRKHLKNESE